MNHGNDKVLSKLQALPTSPGVYLFFGKRGEVLYVGKASSLRSRVRSYFQQGTTDTRIFFDDLVRQVDNLETLVVRTEKEAALLERTLIKERSPKYNFKLRDDKEYLSLRIDTRAQWPRLELVRRAAHDGATYFGPYDSSRAARQTLHLINRHFQLRTCSDRELRSRKRPCLQYHIKRCPAPCVLDVDHDAYTAHVREVTLFLKGRHEELTRSLREAMSEAAAAMLYEEAARIRDKLRAIERVHEAQNVVSIQRSDQDVFGVYRQADQAEVAVLQIRGGKLVHVHTYSVASTALPTEELVSTFVSEYYELAHALPDEIVVGVHMEASDGLQELLTERRGKKVRILMPMRGNRVSLVQLAEANAQHAYEEKSREQADTVRRLREVQEKLHLATLPRRIECIDISHTQGQDTVGAIVALLDGEPDRARYRTFIVRGVTPGDDYGAMRHVLTRRLKRSYSRDAAWDLPDLLVVDGGRGQLSTALSVLQDVGVTHLPVAALAKEKDNTKGETVYDRVYLPNQKNPVVLRENSASLYMLALARDEAHRVSNRLRVKQSSKRMFARRDDRVR
jgi:excinuclease ABC subunit C